jgi:opacity protein-like surface antigen
VKYLLIVPGILATVSSFAATPQVRNMVYGGVETSRAVSYQTPFTNGGFYVGVNGALNLSNFSNNQTLFYTDGTSDSVSESFSFEQSLGFGVRAGYQFAPNWRAELGYQYAGKFEDADNEGDFSMTRQNVMLNILYTAAEWNTTELYLGLGGGAALVETRLSSPHFVDDGNDTQSATTFAGQFILGIEESLTTNLSIGAEYRIGYSGGMTNERMESDPDLEKFTAEIDGIITNSVMLGLRYKF